MVYKSPPDSLVAQNPWDISFDGLAASPKGGQMQFQPAWQNRDGPHICLCGHLIPEWRVGATCDLEYLVSSSFSYLLTVVCALLEGGDQSPVGLQPPLYCPSAPGGMRADGSAVIRKCPLSLAPATCYSLPGYYSPGHQSGQLK